MNLTLGSTLTLSDGSEIPRVGLGSFKTLGKGGSAALEAALRSEYRWMLVKHTRMSMIGKVVFDCGIPRSEVFLSTKQESVPKLDQSEGKSGDGHIDLMLIHAARGAPEGCANTWKAFQAAQRQGRIKIRGVSNFSIKHLEALPPPLPVLNQIEVHPWCQQRLIVEYCQKKGFAIEAYCPLAQAQKERWDDPVLQRVCAKDGTKENMSSAKGFYRHERINSNADVFDFELDQSDIEALDGLEQRAAGAVQWNPVDKDTV